jgi:uncharacterized membrane-anchored protein YhcB (DUF1043 family)
MNLRLISTITTLAISLLASSHMAVAAVAEEEPQQEVFRDYSQEAIRLAREKVQEATSSGAFGHGVPILNTWTDMNMIAILLAVVAVGVGIGIIYYAFRNKNQKTATSLVSN